MTEELSSLSPFSAYLESFLGLGDSESVSIFVGVSIFILFIITPALLMTTYLERKFAAALQMRRGPNRVGKFGIFQIIADLLKLYGKEDVAQTNASHWARWGIVFGIISVFVALANIPFAHDWALANPESGVTVVFSAMIFCTICLFCSIQSDGHEWATYSSFRALALFGAYLLPSALGIVPVVFLTGTTNLIRIVELQGGMPWNWFVFHNPGTLVSFFVLFISLHLWQGRAPFDLVRIFPGLYESTFTVTHSGSRYGANLFLRQLFFLFGCSLTVALYLGGGSTPVDLQFFGRAASFIECLIFLLKVYVLVLLAVWFRWSTIRMNMDQVISLSWRLLLPFGALGLLMTATWLTFSSGRGLGDFL